MMTFYGWWTTKGTELLHNIWFADDPSVDLPLKVKATCESAFEGGKEAGVEWLQARVHSLEAELSEANKLVNELEVAHQEAIEAYEAREKGESLRLEESRRWDSFKPGDMK